jgi:hypothetical protein
MHKRNSRVGCMFVFEIEVSLLGHRVIVFSYASLPEQEEKKPT